MEKTGKHLDRRVRRTKRLLKNAFIEILNEKNYEQIFVSDIVECADYNRATFYRHYENKEELVNELITDQTEGLIDSIRKIYKNRDRLHLEFMPVGEIKIFNHIFENRDFYRQWSNLAVIPGFQEKFINSLSSFFKNEIVIVSNPVQGLNNHLYTSFYAYGILGLILDWIKSDLTYSPDYMATQLRKILNYYPGESYLSGRE